MGYSATLVPFSSFLSGFLCGRGRGVRDREEHPLVINNWGGVSVVPSQPAHQALFWVSILGLLVIVGVDQKPDVVLLGGPYSVPCKPHHS